MGLRFRKRIGILPGLWVNLSKTGVSATAGPRGATTNFGRRGVRTTLSWLGTGLSYVFTWGKRR